MVCFDTADRAAISSIFAPRYPLLRNTFSAASRIALCFRAELPVSSFWAGLAAAVRVGISSSLGRKSVLDQIVLDGLVLAQFTVLDGLVLERTSTLFPDQDRIMHVHRREHGSLIRSF